MNELGGMSLVDTSMLAAAASAELSDWGTLEEATGEPMQVRGAVLWAYGDQESGVWECTPGSSYWEQEQNEFVLILSGALTVTADGGSPVALAAGDCAMFPRGWRGTWELHETVRKVYVVF
jgi:uncharacterized protein